ncbi:hypothetical protein LTR56_015205 [Elasticomyces elasticus]|nr:hypothetical protein LTR56_015205 [Elasticomyces elasticus]KAK3644499.1 hypothetical protein LTR22_015219 [Elasticomyces elasticus]KAK4915536.1 hypothetical protein LTR49_016383 [Elasticomyces elasticus]KAK5756253.1 hypothetical protein LTS12_013677 [Elasticomyces elasticus]
MANAHCPLLLLPAELRNHIWELVIERPKRVTAPSTKIFEDPYNQLSRDPSDPWGYLEDTSDVEPSYRAFLRDIFRNSRWLPRPRPMPPSPRLKLAPPRSLQVCHLMRAELSPMYYGQTRFSFNGLRDEDDVRQFVGWVRNLDKAGVDNIRHMAMWWRTPYRSTLSQDPVAIHVYVQTQGDKSEGKAKVNWQYRVAQHVRHRGRSEAKQEAVAEMKRVKDWLERRVSKKMESSGDSLNMHDWADLVSQMFAKIPTTSSV